MTNYAYSPNPKRLFQLTICLSFVVALMGIAPSWSQDSATTTVEPATSGPTDGENESDREPSKLNLLSLMLQGGWLMVPIAILSILVVALFIERLLSLRRAKVLPASLTEELDALTNTNEGFDIQQAFDICQRYPSAGANIVCAMLLKLGRPQAEIEGAVSEANEREAAKLFHNVRWLTLGAGVAPLLGLLGTVWGMIQAFFNTTQLQPGQSKTDFLAGGIYVALVTTLGGLIVAIPAAICAHYLEGRIQKLFHVIDDFLADMLGCVEQYEGRIRVAKLRSTDSSQEKISIIRRRKTAVHPSPAAESVLSDSDN